jgi:hypothetical protein
MPNFTIPATPAGRRVSRDQWIFPKRRVALEFELRWPARFEGIFEPKLDGVLGWEPGIATAAFNDQISNDRSRVITNADERRAVERVDFVQTRFGM